MAATPASADRNFQFTDDDAAAIIASDGEYDPTSSIPANASRLYQPNVNEPLLEGRVTGKKYLPPPPAPPEELLTFPLAKKLPQLATSAGLVLTLGQLCGHIDESSLPAAGIAAFLAGAAALPLSFFQHDVMHMRSALVTPRHRALEFLTGIVTGMHWRSGATNVHVNHHAVPGDFQGKLAPPDFHQPKPLQDGDQDDLWGLLRLGVPCPKLAESVPAIRMALMGASVGAAVLLFHPMFILQGLLYFCKVEARGEGTADGRASGAATLLHLATMVPFLGPFGYLMFSAGISVTTNVLAVPFHDPAGVEKSEGNYWYQVAKSTRNLRMHDNPLVSWLLNGVNYHLEHHLWEDVPSENLHALVPLAKQYLEENGLEYTELSVGEGWKQALEVGWNLAATPRRISIVNNII